MLIPSVFIKNKLYLPICCGELCLDRLKCGILLNPVGGRWPGYSGSYPAPPGYTGLYPGLKGGGARVVLVRSLCPIGPKYIFQNIYRIYDRKY